MRFVFLNPVAEFGGAERALLAWMAGVQRAFPEAELHLIVPGEGLLCVRARVLGVTVNVLPLPAIISRLGDTALRGSPSLLAKVSGLGRMLAAVPTVVVYARRLNRLLRSLAPDLVHSNGLKTHILLRVSGWSDSPVVWHLHDFVSHRPLMRLLLSRASGCASTAVAVSDAVKKDAVPVLLGLPISVVHNVTDPDQFRPEPAEGCLLDRLAGLPPPEGRLIRVVMVATYARWKGHDVFLHAAARCLANGCPVRFFIVGGPIYRTAGSQFTAEELRGMAAGLGIARSVGFIGYQEDPSVVYRAADIVVHASTRAEPFGLTIVEAMACGRPTVVSLAGGVGEIVNDGCDSLATSPGDADQLAVAVARLAGDAQLRERLGVAARDRVLSCFSPEGLAARIGAVYCPLLDGLRPRK